MDPWSRGRESARVQRSSPKPEKRTYFAIGEGSRIFVACFLHSSAQMCLYQTPGRRPPPLTGRFVNTVTRGWVGALTSATRYDFTAQSLVLSIDVCPGLGISPLRAIICPSFSQADIGPRSADDLFFSGISIRLNFFFEDFIASGTETFWRVSMKFKLFLRKHRVSIVTNQI